MRASKTFLMIGQLLRKVAPLFLEDADGACDLCAHALKLADHSFLYLVL